MTASHVVLVGLSGTGKSTVAPLLGRDLDVGAVDLDRLVESDAGVAVSDLFAAEGEAAFRRRELEALRTALDGPACVVATGGGVLTTAEARTALSDGGVTVVWLRAAPSELARRLEGTAEPRPLLAGGEVESTLRAMAEQRDPLYAMVADVVVEVGGRSPVEVAAELSAVLALAAGAGGADRPTGERGHG